MRLLSFLIFFF
jgi:hypothetical protein